MQSSVTALHIHSTKLTDECGLLINKIHYWQPVQEDNKIVQVTYFTVDT